MRFLNILILSVFSLGVLSCGGDAPALLGADALNESVLLPPGSFQVEAASLVESTELSVTPTAGSNGVMQVNPGDEMTTRINFTAQQGLTHVGIRFGTSGNTWMVPVSGAQGVTSGSVDLPFTIPSSICDDLSGICHDIKCYEFAARNTGSGTFNISRGNINQLAMACGNCDEPSCQDLLGPECVSNTVDATTCAGLAEQFNDISIRYQNALQNGQNYCGFISEILTLIRSNQYKSCVTQFGGLSEQQYNELVALWVDLQNQLC